MQTVLFNVTNINTTVRPLCENLQRRDPKQYANTCLNSMQQSQTIGHYMHHAI
jgi:hypothetical protein